MLNSLPGFLRRDYPFYLSLIFFVFPFVYTLQGVYPNYILFITIGALVSYIALLYTKNKYLIFIEWFFLVFYIVYMTIIIYPMNMLFSFYLSNLLVWNFHDDYKTYRSISFFIAINFMMVYISLLSISIGDKLIMFCFYFICLATYFSQKIGYEKNKIREERTKHNEHINILLAENERNRIGSDLHDSIGHTFVMLKLKSELAEKYLEKNKIELAKKELQEISKISKEAMDNTRAIINKLKHRSIEEEIRIIQDIMIMSDITLTIKNTLTKKPSSLYEWSITMILKELSNNIIKHSKATKCAIMIDENTDSFSIIATDNGDGFKKLTGRELNSIKERLKIVDGKVEITSQKNPTEIKITLTKN